MVVIFRQFGVELLRGKLRYSRGANGLVCLLLTALLLSCGGCSRAFYRRQADEETYALIDQAAAHSGPRGLSPHMAPLEDYSIQVDPRSRMFDPFNPDHSPMPLDDPASHSLMHCVDCKQGYAHWHENGDISRVDNPDWMAYLPLRDDGCLELRANDAVRLARLHSRNFQGELEELYLSALDVTFERFRFDAQFFGGYHTRYTNDGRARPGGGGDDASVLTVGTFPATRGIRIERLYTSGAELVVGLANSLVWQFSGTNSHSATTLLDFALVQPLLRAGGRARVLERLTIAERSLLANVRQMERFRRGFYVDITTGRDAGPGPARRGGFFGGSGLEGFTGVGGGGFGRVGQTGSGGGGEGFAGGAGAAQAGGYLGLLQDQQNIRNQQASVAALRGSLAQLEAFRRANRIDYFQVELARQALFTGQSRLLTSRAAYHSTLDNYKITLGLPPQLCVVIEDPLLDPFNLIDSRIVPLQNRLTDIQEEAGRTIVSIFPAEVSSEQQAAAPITWDDSLAARLRQLKRLVTLADEIRTRVAEENVSRARDDIGRLTDSLDSRRRDLRRLGSRLHDQLSADVNLQAAPGDAVGQERDNSAAEIEKLNRLPGELEKSLTALTGRLEKHGEVLTSLKQDIDELLASGPTLAPRDLAERLRGKVLAPIPSQLSEISAEVLELSLLQARARTESIVLVPIELDPDTALRIACRNRRDWMNAQANLVDSWRLIEFNANDLESGLDVVFSGDISNTGDNPLRLSDTTGRLRVGLEFDAPLTRLSERNTYRQALIEYQQARRSYYAFADRIAQSLRGTLRTIELNRLNFELRRVAVHVAISQVELVRMRLQEPPKPEEEQVFGATTARDLVSALSDLLNVQNDFLSVWVNYEVQRRSLDFDLGTMQLDAEGIWIDPGPITAESGLPGSTGGEHGETETIETPPLPLPEPGQPAALAPSRQPLAADYCPACLSDTDTLVVVVGFNSQDAGVDSALRRHPRPSPRRFRR